MSRTLARRSGPRVVSLVQQRWTLSVINWRRSSVDSRQYLQRSKVYLRVQHDANKAGSRAGPPATADTCFDLLV